MTNLCAGIDPIREGEFDTFSFKVETDDKNEGNRTPMLLRFKVPVNFDFANLDDPESSSPIFVSVCKESDADSVRLHARVYITCSGMVILQTPDIPGLSEDMTDPEFSYSHPDCDDAAYEKYRVYRRYCKEIFLKIKSKFHNDIHHDSDIRDVAGNLDGPDEMCFTLSYGSCLRDTLKLFSNRVIQTLQDSLESLGYFYRLMENTSLRDRLKVGERKDSLFHIRYCYINGYITYGRSFMNTFKEYFESGYFEKVMDSIDRYEESVNTLYHAHNNDDSHRLNNTIKVLTVITIIVGAAGIVISL